MYANIANLEEENVAVEFLFANNGHLFKTILILNTPCSIEGESTY